MSKAEEVFRAIEALRAELTRLRQVEKDYARLQREFDALQAEAEQGKTATPPVRVEAFLFSQGLGSYTGHFASNLPEFYEALRVVPAESLEFHLSRGDFEAWLKAIGSEELASAFGAVRNEGLSGEALRRRLIELVRSSRASEEKQ